MGQEDGTSPALWRERLALSVPEIRRLLGALVFRPTITGRMTIASSRWRRRHQQTGKPCHCRARQRDR
jgi:hypothetical protein